MTTRTDSTPFDFNIGENPSEITNIFETRLLAWKHVVKEYIKHFEEVASAEESFAKGLAKTQPTLTVPFKEHHLFIPESEPGMQQLTLLFKEYHNELAANYSKTAKSITNETIKDLNTLKNDIKRKHKEVETEHDKINKGLVKSHSHTKESMGTLSKAMAPTTSESSTREDPWLANHGLKRQISKHVDRQNSYIKSMQSSVHTLNSFEESIVSTLKRIIKTYFLWKNESTSELTQFSNKIDSAVTTIPDGGEWANFTEKNPSVVSSENAIATANDIHYPERDNPLLEAPKSGPIQYKSGMGPFKKFKDHYAFLTGTGFLHIFPSSDLSLHEEPEYSVDLTGATLGPLPKGGSTEFFVTQKQSGLFKSDTDYEFNFNTHEEAKEWWLKISEKADGVIRSDGDEGGTITKPLLPATAAEVGGDHKAPPAQPVPVSDSVGGSNVPPVRSPSFTDNVGEIRPPPPKPVADVSGANNVPPVHSSSAAGNVGNTSVPPVHSTTVADNLGTTAAQPVHSTPVAGTLGNTTTAPSHSTPISDTAGYTSAQPAHSTPISDSVGYTSAQPAHSTPISDSVGYTSAPPVHSTPVADNVANISAPPVHSTQNIEPIPIIKAGPGDILTPRS